MEPVMELGTSISTIPGNGPQIATSKQTYALTKSREVRQCAPVVDLLVYLNVLQATTGSGPCIGVVTARMRGRERLCHGE